MHKNVRKYFAVAAIAISLSTPSLAQDAKGELLCRQSCMAELRACIQRAPNAYARIICSENFVSCAEGCSLTD